MKTSGILKWIAWALTILVAIVLSIKSFREPDLWWMLRTGQWIVENGKVVTKDVFSFTFEGVDWINVKWLFEVIIYLINRIGGPEFIYILQTIVNVSLVYLIFKVTLTIKKGFRIECKNVPTIGIVIATFIVLFSSEYRMIGRPEMCSHLMTMLFILKYLSYRTRPSISIYFLVFFMILWTNLHEAYGTGLVIIIVMLGAALLEYYYLNKLTNKQDNFFPKHLVIASVLAILAIGVNPHGLKMILHPFEIFSQVGENKYTLELYSYKTSYYWQQKEAYLAIGFFALGIIAFFTKFALDNKKLKWYLRPVSNYGLGYFGLFILFFYLALTAHRNIIFFILISSPLIAVYIDFIVTRLLRKDNKRKAQLRQLAYIILIIFGFIYYYGVGSNKYYQVFNNRDKYGMKIYSEKNPCGVTEFIKENNIKGTCFSDYLTSSYLLWHLRPDFKTYIDLRDLDIFSQEFFQEFIGLVYFPERFAKVDSQYQFNNVVLYRPQFPKLHKYLFDNQSWALVYADPVAVLYLKKIPGNAQIIKKYGLNASREDIFSNPYHIQPSAIATVYSQIFFPLYDKNKKEIHDYDLIAADYYKSLSQYSAAIKRAEKAVENNIDSYLAFDMLGKIYTEMGHLDTNNTHKEVVYGKAIEAFQKGIRVDKNRTDCYKGLAVVAIQRGDWMAANSYLERASDIDKNDFDSYLGLAQCQDALMLQNPNNASYYLEKWLEYMESAYKIKQNDIDVKFSLGITYCKMNECDKANKYLKGMSKVPGLNKEQHTALEKCKMSCGID